MLDKLVRCDCGKAPVRIEMMFKAQKTLLSSSSSLLIMFCPCRGLCSRRGDFGCLLPLRDCLNSSSRWMASLLCGFCCTKCPQHRPRCVSASWHSFGRQMQNQVLPQKKKITAGSPSLPGAAKVSVQAAQGSGGSGDRGLFLMLGRKRCASLSCWAPRAPRPLCH